MPAAHAHPEDDQTCRFDPALVWRLQEQHVTLQNVLDKVALAAECGHYSMLKTGLAILLRCLREHTQQEHRELYPYLRERLRTDERALAFVQSLCEGIRPVETALRDFAQRYLHRGVCSANIAEFLEQLQPVAERLRARLLLEEHSVFPRYREIE